MSELAVVERPQKREIISVVDPVPILDTARFEHMQRIANVMARSSMIPETLRSVGTRDNKEDLPFEQVLSNCFLVVNQAARWGIDPFSAISCCSVVHGRLAYEGKLVSAVLDAKLGVKLDHYFTGNPTADDFRIYLSDQKFTPETIAQLKPGATVPGLRLWDGSVGEWKTTGAGTPWTPKNYRRMLIYRGTRDWTRIYESAILLGVYTEDELIDLVEDARARRATPVVSLADRLAASKTASLEAPGFSQDHVNQELAGSSTGAQREATGLDPAPASSGDEPQAPDQGALSSAPEGAQDRRESAPSPSPQAPPPSSEDKPAPDDQVQASSGAGDPPSPLTTVGTGPLGGDTRQEDEPKPSNIAEGRSSLLPEGWATQYAAALKRASKPLQLQKRAAEFWAPLGGWIAHKDGPDAETAKAIFDACERYFANHTERDAILHELGAD